MNQDERNPQTYVGIVIPCSFILEEMVTDTELKIFTFESACSREGSKAEVLFRHANNQKCQSRKSVVEPVTALIKSAASASAKLVIVTEMGCRGSGKEM